MKSRTCALGAAFASLVATSAPGTAQAGDGDYPLVYGQRPLVLTKGLQQVEGAFGFLRPDVAGADLAVSVLGSYEIGITDEITAGVIAVPLGISPEVNYGQPVAYATLRLADAEAYDLGIRGRLTFPGPEGGDVGIAFGLAGRFQIHKAAWVDAGALVDVTLSDPAVTTLEVPLNLGVSLTRQLFFTLDTSLKVPEADFDVASVSSFAGLGYTVGVESPRLDLYLRAGLPHIAFQEPVSYDTQIQIGGRYFFR